MSHIIETQNWKLDVETQIILRQYVSFSYLWNLSITIYNDNSYIEIYPETEDLSSSSEYYLRVISIKYLK